MTTRTEGTILRIQPKQAENLWDLGCSYGLRSSLTLRSVCWQVDIQVSEQPIGPIFPKRRQTATNITLSNIQEKGRHQVENIIRDI